MIGFYGTRAFRTIAAALTVLVSFAATEMQGARAERQGVLCVLVPHFKDEYWLSVAYGLEQESRRQSVTPRFFEAGGYQARARQIVQLEACVDLGAEAVLIGAVSSDHPDLLAAIARTAAKIPVIALVNELHSDALSGRIGVDWRDMGVALGRFLAARYRPGAPPRTAILLSGPAEAGWVGPLETGLRDGLRGAALRIAAVLRADTGLREQLVLVERVLTDYPDADYLIGPAPAIEAAMGLYETAPGGRKPELLATYLSHSVRRGLINGKTLAAPYDDPVAQGALAVRVTLEAMHGAGSDTMIGPPVVVVTQASAASQLRLSPADYFPTIE